MGRVTSRVRGHLAASRDPRKAVKCVGRRQGVVERWKSVRRQRGVRRLGGIGQSTRTHTAVHVQRGQSRPFTLWTTIGSVLPLSRARARTHTHTHTSTWSSETRPPADTHLSPDHRRPQHSLSLSLSLSPPAAVSAAVAAAAAAHTAAVAALAG